MIYDGIGMDLTGLQAINGPLAITFLLLGFTRTAPKVKIGPITDAFNLFLMLFGIVEVSMIFIDGLGFLFCNQQPGCGVMVPYRPPIYITGLILFAIIGLSLIFIKLKRLQPQKLKQIFLFILAVSIFSLILQISYLASGKIHQRYLGYHISNSEKRAEYVHSRAQKLIDIQLYTLPGVSPKGSMFDFGKDAKTAILNLHYQLPQGELRISERNKHYYPQATNCSLYTLNNGNACMHIATTPNKREIYAQTNRDHTVWIDLGSTFLSISYTSGISREKLIEVVDQLSPSDPNNIHFSYSL